MNHRSFFSWIIIILVIGAVLFGYVYLKKNRTISLSQDPRANIPALNFSGTAMRKPAHKATLFTGINNQVKSDEVYNRLKQQLALKSEDSDNDQLSDLAEVLLYGTNVFYHDSDLDGTTDGAEVAANTNPAGSDTVWSSQAQELIAKRKDYWGTDFALSSERKQQSEQDLQHINQAGKISVMLQSYYEKNKKYPVADTWVTAWEQVSKTDTGKLFGTFTPDMLYSYASDGVKYTFSYTLEGTQEIVSQQGKKGKAGSVVKTAASAASPISWVPSFDISTLVQKIIPTAHALPPVSSVSKTTDGVAVEVYGDPEWITAVKLLSFDKLIAGFLVAAQHGDGYCDSGACYCANGTTLAFGKNDALCTSVVAPKTVVAGEQFPVTMTMRNNGQRFWSTDNTPHRLGFWSSAKTPDDTTWGVTRVELSESPVHVGDSTVFSFNATAPTKAGSYYLAGRMVEDGNEWFGEVCTAAPDGMVTVTDKPVAESSSQAKSSPLISNNPVINPSPFINNATPLPTSTFRPGDFKEKD